MLPLLLLISSISVAVVSQGGRSAADCTVGSKWTVKFIRFECYQGKGVKGVRAIGCVPANNEKGEMVKPGATFDEKHFTYSCAKKGDVVSYQIINCRDINGKKLAVNENRTLADGTTWRCYKDKKSGAIKVSLDKPAGCIFAGVSYAVGKTWTQPIEFKATLKGSKGKIIGKAMRMECKKAGAGFIGVAVGCVTPAGKTFYSGKYIVEDGMNIYCNITVNGKVQIKDVDDKEIECNKDGVVVKNGEKYTTPDGIDVYLCIFKVLKKISCNIFNKPYAADSLVHIKERQFFCNKGPGYVDFGGITGCKLPDGTIKPFYAKFLNGTEIHRCYFTIKKEVVTPYVAFWKCAHKDFEIAKYMVAIDDGVYKKCAWMGEFWAMRLMTAAEIIEWKNKRKPAAGSSDTFGGAGGGSGGEETHELVDPKANKPPPKQAKPATQPKPQNPPAMAASKPAISKTQKLPDSAKLSVKPLLSVVPGKLASPQKTDVSGSNTLPGEKPSPISSGKCVDLFSMCASLAPICAGPADGSVKNLKEIAKQTNVTVDQIKQVFSLMGFDGADTSDENKMEQINEVIRGLIDNSEQDEDSDDCEKKRRPACKKCHIFKKKLHDLVLMVCPATCGSCEKAGQLPIIIKDLVRFYCSKCR